MSWEDYILLVAYLVVVIVILTLYWHVQKKHRRQLHLWLVILIGLILTLTWPMTLGRFFGNGNPYSDNFFHLFISIYFIFLTTLTLYRVIKCSCCQLTDVALAAFFISWSLGNIFLAVRELNFLNYTKLALCNDTLLR